MSEVSLARTVVAKLDAVKFLVTSYHVATQCLKVHNITPNARPNEYMTQKVKYNTIAV